MSIQGVDHISGQGTRGPGKVWDQRAGRWCYPEQVSTPGGEKSQARLARELEIIRSLPRRPAADETAISLRAFEPENNIDITYTLPQAPEVPTITSVDFHKDHINKIGIATIVVSGPDKVNGVIKWTDTKAESIVLDPGRNDIGHEEAYNSTTISAYIAQLPHTEKSASESIFKSIVETVDESTFDTPIEGFPVAQMLFVVAILVLYLFWS